MSIGPVSPVKKKQSPVFKFSLYFLAAIFVVLLFDCFTYAWFYRADIEDRNLLIADKFNLVLSGGLMFAGNIFLYALVLVLVLTTAGHLLKLQWKVFLLIVLSAVFAFYLRGFFVPQMKAYNYTLYWSILETGDARNQRIKMAPADLLAGGYENTSYTGLVQIMDSIRAVNDSSRRQEIAAIRDMASPANIKKLLQHETLGKFFMAEDFAGVRDRGRDVQTDSLNYYLVEVRAQQLIYVQDMREQMLLRYRNERNRMVFFPFHVFLLALIAFLGGRWLHALRPRLQWVLAALAIAPCAVILQNMIMAKENKEIISVVPGHWWLLLLEIASLVCLYIASKKSARHATGLHAGDSSLRSA